MGATACSQNGRLWNVRTREQSRLRWEVGQVRFGDVERRSF